MNDNGKKYVTLQWLVAILTTLVLGLAANWAYNISSQLDKISYKVDSYGSALAELKVKLEETRTRLDEVKGER